MTAVQSVLVVGGGSAANAVTLFLRRAGVDVTVIDADPLGTGSYPPGRSRGSAHRDAGSTSQGP